MNNQSNLWSSNVAGCPVEDGAQVAIICDGSVKTNAENWAFADVCYGGTYPINADGAKESLQPIEYSSTVSISAIQTASYALNASPTSGPALWINTLSDTVLQKDMASASLGGTVTESGMAKLFGDLAGELSANHASLSANQLADLKTIAADINVGESASSYLTYITNALVNGDLANATWSGGGKTANPLGNLSVGTTANQLSELDGKWFLGTDLPVSAMSQTAVKGVLFGSGGPSMNDINQGQLGDCYFLAALAEVANQTPSLVQSMIIDNGNDTYGVRFFVNGKSEYVTVNNSLVAGGKYYNQSADLWASLVEKAYAQLQADGDVTGNPAANFGNSYASIGSGGAPDHALAEVTGATTLTNFFATGSTWTSFTEDSSFKATGYHQGLSSACLLSTLVTDLAKGYDLVLCSNTSATDASGKITLVADHALSIYGFDAGTGNLEIRNPWGATSWQTWDTTFEVSLNTLLADGDMITVNNGLLAPLVAHQTADQVWSPGQKISFSIPSNAFTDPQGQALIYTAKLASGAALPSWLTFGNNTFSGVVPNTSPTFTVIVSATDSSGMVGTESFSVAPYYKPTVFIPTADQQETVGHSFSFTLPSQTFVDPQGSPLMYSATLADGSALPSWLHFDAKAEVFSAIAPSTVGSVSVSVVATDDKGGSATDTFAFDFSKPFTPLVTFLGSNGTSPQGTLMIDANGNVFGTTWTGGANNCGTVFELAKTITGYAAAPTTICNFSGASGAFLDGKLFTDADGNLFGAAEGGGQFGKGTIFEIKKTPSGYGSTPITLVSFHGSDGAQPDDGFIADANGNLIGTTQQGGASDNGTVFMIAKTASGYASTPITLVSFNGANGSQPVINPIMDSKGDLFGTTWGGGANGCGVIYEIVKAASGYASTPTILANLGGAEGAYLSGSLVMDANGNLFGTTRYGGAYGDGTIFELAKTVGGYASKITTLLTFNGTNGASMAGTLVMDGTGDLFGVTTSGGAFGHGTVFELQKSAIGYASTTISLVDFSGINGSKPMGSLAFDANGNLFGTTSQGGTTGNGTVFEISSIDIARTSALAGIAALAVSQTNQGVMGVADCQVSNVNLVAVPHLLASDFVV